MIYYSLNKKILDTDKYSKFDHGGNSTIYKNIGSDILFKVYKFDINYRYHMRKKNFEMLKEKNIPNLVKLMDYYFQFDQKINSILPMDAYTMKMVKGKKIDLIDMDRNYMKNILEQLEETLKCLSNEKILIGDAHKDNIIFNENGVTLIDLDQFIKMGLYSKKGIYDANKSSLMHIITMKILMEFRKKNPNLSLPFFWSKEDTSLYDDCEFLLEEENVEDSVKKYSYKRN